MNGWVKVSWGQDQFNHDFYVVATPVTATLGDAIDDAAADLLRMLADQHIRNQTGQVPHEPA